MAVSENLSRLGNSGWWTLKNEGANDVPAHGLINLTGIEKDDSKQWILTGDRPDSAANFLLAVNGPTQIAAGKKGICLPLCPVFFMAYDTADGTPANEQNWGADNGTFKLKKNFGGGNWAVIGADEENEIALVMVTGSVILLGTTDEAIANAGNGDVLIYAGTILSETSTGDTITGYNRGEAIATGIAVNVHRRNSAWEIYPLECNP